MKNSKRAGCLCTLVIIVLCCIYSLAWGAEMIGDATININKQCVEEQVVKEKAEVVKVTRYTKDALNLRAKAGTKYKIKTVIPYGAKVTLYKGKCQRDGWSYIKYGKKTGYVMTKYLTKKKPASNKVYLGKFELTAYYNKYNNHTASGTWPTAGRTVAINGIPLGTKVYIEGIGYRIVEDRGEMASNVVDVFYNTYGECVNFGRKYNVKVYKVN